MNAPPLRSFSLADLETLEFPPLAFVVDQLIPTGGLVLLVGRPKAGKSLLGLDLAVSVACGETFLGRATTAGPVVLVPGEDALSLVRSRLWARLGPERAAPLHVIPADGSLDQSVRLDDAASFARLAAKVAELEPALLILDPLREFHTRKENDADEMAALLRPLRQLAHETGTAILLVHHRNKHATDASRATRGSSAIPGSVDVIITLDCPDDEAGGEAAGKVLTLSAEGRYGPRQHLGAQLGAGLRWELAGARVGDESLAPRIARHLEVTGAVLAAEELAEALQAAKGSVQNALTGLYKRGRVRRVGAGTKTTPYRYGIVAGPSGASVRHVLAWEQGKAPIRHDHDEDTPAGRDESSAVGDEVVEWRK